jgi:hypothetical protein
LKLIYLNHRDECFAKKTQKIGISDFISPFSVIYQMATGTIDPRSDFREPLGVDDFPNPSNRRRVLEAIVASAQNLYNFRQVRQPQIIET